MSVIVIVIIIEHSPMNRVLSGRSVVRVISVREDALEGRRKNAARRINEILQSPYLPTESLAVWTFDAPPPHAIQVSVPT